MPNYIFGDLTWNDPKINGKQRVIMPKKGEYVKFKNFEKIK